jgi:hypothetical protein
MDARERRFALMMAVVAILLGAFGFVYALDARFDAPGGVRVLTGQFLGGGELLFLNRIGALVTVVLGVLALAGTLSGRRRLLLAAGVGFGAAALITLVQTGGDTNWLGGRASTFAFFLAGATGFPILSWPSAQTSFSSDSPRR